MSSQPHLIIQIKVHCRHSYVNDSQNTLFNSPIAVISYVTLNLFNELLIDKPINTFSICVNHHVDFLWFNYVLTEKQSRYSEVKNNRNVCVSGAAGPARGWEARPRDGTTWTGSSREYTTPTYWREKMSHGLAFQELIYCPLKLSSLDPFLQLNSWGKQCLEPRLDILVITFVLIPAAVT